MKVLAVAGDAGGARAILPVIHQLKSAGINVDCRTHAAATEIWKKAGLQPEMVFPLRVQDYDRIMLGTTAGAERFDLEIIRQANRHSIRTISVLDSWVNYRERYTEPDGTFILPDIIAVMDERAKNEMIALGFPAERLYITGHPAFDALKQYRAQIGDDPSSLEDKLKILYVSQPLSQLTEREKLGFDEQEVLCDVVDALSEICERRKASAVMYLKLHPREIGKKYDLPFKRSSFLEVLTVDAFSDPRRAVLSCDLIIGMNSILLMEACFLEKPVVSYQPNLRLADSLPSNRNGWSKAVYWRKELVSVLETELFDKEARAVRKQILAAIPKNFDAAARVAKLVLAE